MKPSEPVIALRRVHIRFAKANATKDWPGEQYSVGGVLFLVLLSFSVFVPELV